MKFNCTNKKCQHEFHSKEDKVFIQCPVCGKKLVNKYKVVTSENFLYIESMLKNIDTYGEEETLNLIDRCYPNPKTRIRVRQMFYNTVKLLKEEK